jgi:hypothetical protein
LQRRPLSDFGPSSPLDVGPIAQRLCDHLSLDDSSRNRQPNPHALRLGREERFKHLLYLVRQNAGTGIGNRHFGKMVDARGSDGDLAFDLPSHFPDYSIIFGRRSRDGLEPRWLGGLEVDRQLEDWWVAIPKAGIADAYVEQALIWSSALDFKR